MGLVAKLIEKRMKDPVEGTARVVSGSWPDASATSQNYAIECIVVAPGIEPTAVRHTGVAKTSKWPSAGDELPITVDRADPERFVIHWDRVETAREHNQRLAQQLAEQMRAGGTPAPAAGAGDAAAFLASAQQFQAQAAQFAQMAGAMGPRKADSATILATGRPGTATLLEWFQVPLAPKDAQHQLVGLSLSVTLEGIAAYQTRAAYNVPLDKVSRLIPGTTLPVKADQQNLTLVAVDWDAF